MNDDYNNRIGLNFGEIVQDIPGEGMICQEKVTEEGVKREKYMRNVDES